VVKIEIEEVKDIKDNGAKKKRIDNKPAV